MARLEAACRLVELSDTVAARASLGLVDGTDLDLDEALRKADAALYLMKSTVVRETTAPRVLTSTAMTALSRPDVLVVGAGLAGLVAARRLEAAVGTSWWWRPVTAWAAGRGRTPPNSAARSIEVRRASEPLTRPSSRSATSWDRTRGADGRPCPRGRPRRPRRSAGGGGGGSRCRRRGRPLHPGPRGSGRIPRSRGRCGRRRSSTGSTRRTSVPSSGPRPRAWRRGCGSVGECVPGGCSRRRRSRSSPSLARCTPGGRRSRPSAGASWVVPTRSPGGSPETCSSRSGPRHPSAPSITWPDVCVLADGRTVEADDWSSPTPLPVLGRIWPEVPTALAAVSAGLGGTVAMELDRRIWLDYGRSGRVLSDRAWGEMVRRERCRARRRCVC